MIRRRKKVSVTASLAANSVYDYSLGDKVAEWIEANCRCPEGARVGKPVELTPEQRLFLRETFKRRDGVRVVRQAILSAGRKFGKTVFCACIVLAFLCGPLAGRNQNRAFYSSALKREQAALLFDRAVQIIRFSHRLSSLIVIRMSLKELYCSTSGNSYAALSAEDKTAHGKSPYGVVHDELGQVDGPTSKLYDALDTGSGAHDDPISIIISTQACSDSSLLSVLIDDGFAANDESIYVQLHAANDIDCDIMDERNWLQANPSLGKFANIEYYRKRAERAKRIKPFAAAFRNLLLNQRVSPFAHIISPDLWRDNSGEPNIPAGAQVWLGLDLSKNKDMSAISILHFDGEIYHCEFRYFVPSIGIDIRAEQDKAPYMQWVEEGYLTATPGQIIDYDYIADELEALGQAYDVQVLGVDPYRFEALRKAMEAKGYDVPAAKVKQGVATMAPRIEDLICWAIEGKMRWGTNPVFKFNCASAVAVVDVNDNQMLAKNKSTGRIDGLAALVDAIHAFVVEAPPDKNAGKITEGNLSRFLAVA